MTSKEKGRQMGDPIPNFVWQDEPESNSQVTKLQAAKLARCCAISFAMAEILAPLAFGEVR